MNGHLQEAVLFSVCGLLVAVVGCGCGGPSKTASELAAEKVIEAAAKARRQHVNMGPNSDGEGTSSITITGDDGSATVTTAMIPGGDQTKRDSERNDGHQSIRSGNIIAIPGTFPQDIPLPPSLAITTALHDQSGNGPEWMVQGTLPGTLGEAQTFYTERLQQAGWTLLTSIDTAELLSLNFEKEDRILSIIAGPEGSGIVLSVAVSAR